MDSNFVETLQVLLHLLPVGHTVVSGFYREVAALLRYVRRLQRFSAMLVQFGSREVGCFSEVCTVGVPYTNFTRQVSL